MAGIYIRGMQVPNACSLCSFESEISFFCTILQKPTVQNNVLRNRREDCPLTDVHDHGRLIDADKLHEKAFRRSEKLDGYYNCLDAVISAYDIDTAPTVIPADKEATT